MDQDPFNQVIKTWPPKGVFANLLENYLGMNTGLWSSVCVWFQFFKTVMRIFVMFVNEEVCEIVLIKSSSSDYEFYAAILIFKALVWSVYYYHEMLGDIDRQENYKRLAVYGFYSWRINWYVTPKREKLFMKTSTAYRLLPICSSFSFDPNSN